jgi:hypothetical protein
MSKKKPCRECGGIRGHKLNCPQLKERLLQQQLAALAGVELNEAAMCHPQMLELLEKLQKPS